MFLHRSMQTHGTLRGTFGGIVFAYFDEKHITFATTLLYAAYSINMSDNNSEERSI